MWSPFKRLIAWRAGQKARREEIDRELKAEKEKWETEIKPLHLEEAKRRAEDLLKNSAKFEVVTAPVEDASQLEPLAPHLREFFTKYAAVELWNPVQQFSLNRKEIAPSEDPITRDPHRFLRIGVVDYDEMEFEYAVKPGEEGVYLLGDELPTPDGRLAPVEDPEVSYPSVYHLLLYEILTNRD